MDTRFILSFAVGSALALLSACSGGNETAAPGESAEAGTKDPLARLEIATAKAEKAEAIPLGTVPGQVTLPPEARVAVTAPFPGAAVRIYVIEGQAVSRGQPLALVRAAEPVQIRGELARAQAALGLAEAQAGRMNQLAKEGIIAQARAEEANAALSQARASLAENRRLAAYAGAGPDGTMTLRAPISGRVAHVAVETGGPVDAMTAPFVIENAAAFRIDLQLPERLARQVRPGMAVEVRLGGTGGEALPVGGRILSVAPSIDPLTRSVIAKASIAAAPGMVAGQNVMVVISGSGSATGVTIPASAVTRIDGEDHVFVKDGAGFKPRKVTLAAESGGSAVIGEGLAPGETVATSSIAELKAMAAE